MGSIFGYTGGGYDRAKLLQMSDALRHRGAEVWLGGNGIAGLGCRSMAGTRMGSTVTYGEIEYAVVLDGVISNAAELRKVLHDRRIYCSSTAEILVALYRTFGEKFPEQLSGNFSLAISDGHTLYLARDPIGTRPLVYTGAATGFRFASEIKALFTREEFSCEIMDEESLCERFIFQDHLVGDSTFHIFAKQLQPGNYLIVQSDDSGRVAQSSIGRFHNELTEHNMSVPDIVQQNVARSVASGARIGVLLSGGYDSSVIASLAAKLSSGPIKTFTIADDKNFPDILAARVVANHIGSEHHEFIIPSEPDLRSLSRGIRAYEDMTFRDTAYRLAEKVNGQADLVLCGTGADILGMPLFARARPFITVMNAWNNAKTNGIIGSNSRARDYMKHFVESIEHDRARASFEHYIRDYLPQQLLPSIEKAFMSFGIETGFPFADERIVAISRSLETSEKYAEEETKPFLRKSFSSIGLPKEILERTKLCSKTNLFTVKVNTLRLAERIVPAEYADKHRFARYFRGNRHAMLCFDLLEHHLGGKSAPYIQGLV